MPSCGVNRPYRCYGKELVRFDDRHGREFVLGPTHEETVTALVRNELRSYKQLPVNLYHIQDQVPRRDAAPLLASCAVASSS